MASGCNSFCGHDLCSETGEANNSKLVQGFYVWGQMLRVNSQKFKGMAEAIGLTMLLKGVPKSFFDFAVKLKVSCSYQQCIDILRRRAKTNPIKEVHSIVLTDVDCQLMS